MNASYVEREGGCSESRGYRGLSWVGQGIRLAAIGYQEMVGKVGGSGQRCAWVGCTVSVCRRFASRLLVGFWEVSLYGYQASRSAWGDTAVRLSRPLKSLPVV